VTCINATINGNTTVATARIINIVAKAPNHNTTLHNQAIVDPDNTIPEGNEFDNISNVSTTVTNGGSGPFIELSITKTAVCPLCVAPPAASVVEINHPLQYQLVVSNGGNGMDDYAVLWYLEQDWNDAGVKRDKNWAEKNYASDFTSVSSRNGKLNNKAQDIAEMMDDKGTPELNETTDMETRIDGNVAIVTGVYRSKGKDDKGVAYDRKIRFTDTWIKRDGRWQAWATAGAEIKE